MSRNRNVARLRSKHHAHALERLRERYDADASADDVIEIRNLAVEAYRAWQARGRRPGTPWVIAQPFTDCIETAVDWRGKSVRLVYVPALNAVRSVLPLQSRRDTDRSASAMSPRSGLSP
jgi:hypothetical protein